MYVCYYVNNSHFLSLHYVTPPVVRLRVSVRAWLVRPTQVFLKGQLLWVCLILARVLQDHLVVSIASACDTQTVWCTTGL